MLALAAVLLAATRLALPSAVRWYVNRTLDRNLLYDGRIGDVRLHLWRGAYSIDHVRVIKTTGNVPVPFFSTERMDLAIEWPSLLHGKLVGRVVMEKPELNFVDARDRSEEQTGAGGPWLEIMRDLFPFQINSARLQDGTVHFRAFQVEPPVDVYLSKVEASIENLTNVRDEVVPLISSIRAKGLAMDDANVELEMKLDPFSYRPTFQLALRLLGLDVTKTNALARAYGSFDFEGGWFDLVVELDAKEGRVEGYVKPLFRNLRIFDPAKDAREGNVFTLFWEALIGVAGQVFKNRSRDQVGTVIPLRGDLSSPSRDVLAAIGNLLHNAFVRAYLPKLHGTLSDVGGITYGPGSVVDPGGPAGK